jgi:hypothetical protein
MLEAELSIIASVITAMDPASSESTFRAELATLVTPHLKADLPVLGQLPLKHLRFVSAPMSHKSLAPPNYITTAFVFDETVPNLLNDAADPAAMVTTPEPAGPPSRQSPAAAPQMPEPQQPQSLNPTHRPVRAKRPREPDVAQPSYSMAKRHKTVHKAKTVQAKVVKSRSHLDHPATEPEIPLGIVHLPDLLPPG